MEQIGMLTKCPKRKETVYHEKVLIIGAGPAGLTAALYTARAELEPVVISGIEMGGKLTITNNIENYPGYVNGTPGFDLADAFQKQAEAFGAKILLETVFDVDLSSKPFRISSDCGEHITQCLIIATGASHNVLDVPGEIELVGRGVSYCATCDGPFFRHREIVVVGGGDSALEESLLLTRFAAKITLIHRRPNFRAGAILQRRVRENPKISTLMNHRITEILGQDKVEQIKIQNVENGEFREIKTDGVFVFIGSTPNTQLFSKFLKTDSKGYLEVDSQMRTNIPGIFAAGEVADPYFRQVITSAGMGAAAAISATRYLSE